MDPREERSARLLRTTLFELASSRDISTITAAELSRVTGLARRTIYNHGESPQELLFGYLAEGLTRIRDDGFRDAGLHSAAESFGAGLQRVLEHVQEHRAIYTHAVSATTSPAWHHLLTQHFAVSFAAYLQRYPPRVPAGVGVVGTDLDGAAGRVIASSIAHGMVGAIEAWLRLEDEPGPEVCYRLILALTPSWFLGQD